MLAATDGGQPIRNDNYWREFHVSRRSRELYQFDAGLFSTNGNVVLADFRATRRFARAMNQIRDVANHPERAVQAGQINALGLIDEILHLVISHYQRTTAPLAMAAATAWLEAQFGRETVDRTLLRFVTEFPPVAVYNNQQSVEEYLNSTSGGLSNRQAALEEIVVLWVNNMNPATGPYRELFDDIGLKNDTAYLQLIGQLRAFFDTQPRFGPKNENLIDMLRAPALASPHSLEGQLEFIRTQWPDFISEHFYRLLSSLDLIREETKPVFFGPGPALVPTYGPGGRARGSRRFGKGRHEPERFSVDRDWMPRALVIAKNIYVWLDQLSRKYQREIVRLDQIPDDELDLLAARGFTGIWLIGLWERSSASQRIKQLCGNSDAVASAYSLYGYDIAGDLGGQSALDNFRWRAMQRGLRLASDMVPNHMGIDSRWVVEHPDWFVALDHPPFPTYTFDGPDLSHDDRVGIFLEDHYYSRSDAAVVFKRVDRWTGGTTYIYHGNDGTSMPWNDTAQLNYLKAEVREAVIQTILHVARQFPIIRFDAAMTLAKEHYHRLWFPEPGTGGDIASRAGYGLTHEEFDAAMPEEFWREVVDRVAREVPDTLLLAEAFWMMEGYFVRTLGMHRVYNSAFMNMLRDEENSNYRLVIKNTLEFDPDILKRFVNFMNNPDERTAIDQFGDGDKYFGVCIMMVTLPGLPMFGHGQIEGFHEKYGMEYRRPKWDELANQGLVERHEREIFPLLHSRQVFAEVADFALYDFWNNDGHVCEDVFAYSNRDRDERALVVYHNKFAEARGWIRISVGTAIKAPDGSKKMVRHSLFDKLGLHGGSHHYTIFRDRLSGLEYIRHSQELNQRGLYVELAAYKCHVFMEFREVSDDAPRDYQRLAARLGGRGVPSIDDALVDMIAEPVLVPLAALLDAQLLAALTTLAAGPAKAKTTETAPAPKRKELLDSVERRAADALQAIAKFAGATGAGSNVADGTVDASAVAAEIRRQVAATLRLKTMLTGKAGSYLRGGLTPSARAWNTLFAWTLLHDLGRVVPGPRGDGDLRAADWQHQWGIQRLTARLLAAHGLNQGEVGYAVAQIELLIRHQHWFELSAQRGVRALVEALMNDPRAARVLQQSEYQGLLWYNKEAFEELLWWLFAIAAAAMPAGDPTTTAAALGAHYNIVTALRDASDESGYQVERLLASLPVTVPPTHTNDAPHRQMPRLPVQKAEQP